MVASLSSFVSSRSRCTDRANRLAASREESALDAGLVRRFQAGDDGAFVEIVARHRGRLFHVAFRLLRNSADAEEIAQDTLIRAHRGLALFRGDCSLAAWLYRIALNLSYNRYGYFYRRFRHATLPLDASLSEDNASTFADLIASDAPNPAREMAESEFAAIIARCTDQLPAQQREILGLRNTEHHSYDQIGRMLGISIGTVKSRIARARLTLRARLAQAYPEFASDASPLECFEPLRTSGCLVAVCA